LKGLRLTGRYSRGAELFTGLILETFRLNGSLETVGDKMTKPLGLSTARWQALGAITLAHRPLTVPQIARAMGLQRQSVQRTVNLLLAAGLVVAADNPDHQRARLIVLTEQGRRAYAKAIAIQTRWAEELSAGIDPNALAAALEVLATLRHRIEHQKHSGRRRTKATRPAAGSKTSRPAAAR
jgi:DNA-binding MarR family transcriptional regulator